MVRQSAFSQEEEPDSCHFDGHQIVTKWTVKYHMERIIEILHLENRAQVIAYAACMGFVDDTGSGEKIIVYISGRLLGAGYLVDNNRVKSLTIKKKRVKFNP